MLCNLYIKNYALIEEINVTFAGGLNVVTGETGAGKSILIGAIGLLVGDRAGADVVRVGTTKAVVEGTFTIGDNEPARRVLTGHDYDTGDEVVVRREITSRGSSRAFINDSPAPLSLVKDLGDLLVDLHGQHDHQQLLRPQTHLHLLDDAGGLSKLVTEFRSSFDNVVALERQIDELRQREEQLRQRSDFYQFQLREFDAIDPQPGEEASLEQELRLLENGERLMDLTSSIHSVLYADEQSVRDKLVRARNLIEQLAAIDPSFQEQKSELATAITTVEEIARSVQSYTAGFDVSYERLEELRERLLALSRLRKKFGGTLESALEYRDKIRAETILAMNFDSEITAMETELALARSIAGAKGSQLSKKRREVARKITRSIERVLRTLGIEHGTFAIAIEQTPVPSDHPHSVVVDEESFAATQDGIDRAEFYISTNLGEEPRPLARVASGGEISRVMLALKTILAKNDRLPLLVFDEIDSGISGRIAAKVGATMRDLASYHQIIAITHLPQIAAMSTDHCVVEKHELSGRTITTLRPLDATEHIHEVARLVSGEHITESSLSMARELIDS